MEDPMLSRLNTSEAKVARSVIKYLGNIKDTVFYTIKDVNDTYFSLYISGIKTLRLSTVRKLARCGKTRFRHFEIKQEIQTDSLGLLISFYCNSTKGSKPIGFTSASDEIRCELNMTKLADLKLTKEETIIAEQVVSQFCFAEEYVSGNLFVVAQACENYYEFIFTGPQIIHSAFIANYLLTLTDFKPHISFVPAPFETHVRIYRRVAKHRHGDSDSEDEQIQIKRTLY